MKSVPANGAVSDKMLEAGLAAWESVMEGPPSQKLGGGTLLVLMLMTVYRDMLQAAEKFD